MKHSLSVRAFVFVSAALTSWSAAAQDVSDRAGKIDMNVIVSDFSSKDINGDRGSTATVKGEAALGFGFDYNVDNHWAFGLDFMWRSADYTTTVTPDVGNPGPAFNRSGTIDVSTTAVTAAYNFSPKRFTPFLVGNIGRTWVDTNIPAGPPTTVCWWDPWWGQYCGPTVPTKSDVYWSYGAGIGLRWDSKGPFFIRGSINEQWIDVGGSIGTPSFTLYRVDLGARF